MTNYFLSLCNPLLIRVSDMFAIGEREVDIYSWDDGGI